MIANQSSTPNLIGQNTTVNPEICESVQSLIHGVHTGQILICCLASLINCLELIIFTSKELRSRCSNMLACISACNLTIVLGEIVCYAMQNMGVHVLSLSLKDLGTLERIATLVSITTKILQHFAYSCSVFILVLLSCERCSAVCRPMTHVQLNRTMNTCIFVFLLLFSCGTASLTLCDLSETCHARLRLYMYVHHVLFLLTIPCVLLCVTSFKLMTALKQRKLTLLRLCRIKLSLGTTKIVLLISAIFVSTAGVPKSVMAVYNILITTDTLAVDNGYCIVLSVLYFVEIFNFLSLDSIVYYAYNRRYRRKLHSIIRHVFKKCGTDLTGEKDTTLETPEAEIILKHYSC